MAISLAVLCPLSARTQQSKVHRIGFLANDPTIPNQPAGQAFLDGLRESGFIEGKNILINRRFAEGKPDKYAGLISELISGDPEVIVTSSGDAAYAAKQATKSIPIVMLNVPDPIGRGIVASLARPEGNITGLVQEESPEIAGKRMEFLKDAVSGVSRIAVLTDPESENSDAQWQQLELVAPALNLTMRSVVARRADQFEGVFKGLEEERPEALFVGSGLNFTNRSLIMGLALKSRLPTMSNFKESTQAGGLMSYGSNRLDSFHGAAIYVAKILKGAKPSELPIEQPTKYELVSNLKTAKALNLEIPRSLQLLADDVIE